MNNVEIEELKSFVYVNAFYGWENATHTNVMKAIDDFFNAKLIAKMNWIKCEDQMPEKFVDVLIYCISDGVSKHGFPNTYDKDQEYMAIDRVVTWTDGYDPSFRADRFFGKVIGWMPLPKPPEE